ncbi:MAG: dethiobiotin synthase [Chitinophagales bacterium]|nr:dethiobiotin synthase [Chitinophagales bacterium]
MSKLFITGIGTDVGKTVVSAIVCEALKADYWKPIQSGNIEGTDRATVKSLVSNDTSTFHPEVYNLKEPVSPHYAAQLEGVEIDMDKIVLPETKRPLVIEGAGGLLVPLNRQHLVADLIVHLEAPTIIVSRNYLGSINHTLLTIEFMRYRNIAIAGIIFNGQPNPSTEEAILHFGNIPLLGRIGQEPNLSPQVISRYAESIKKELNHIIEKDEFI